MEPNNRLGSHNLPTLQTMLSDRDREMIRLVWEHKFLTTRQLQRLLFWRHATTDAGTRACVRVLARLREKRFLYRLERQIGGVRGGSGAFVWGIGPAGDRIMRAEPNSVRTKRTRSFEPTGLFLNHTLAVAEVRVQLEEAAQQGDLELLDIETEPANWRTFTSRDGSAQILKPDLRTVTAVRDFEDHWFLEIDLGTEATPALLRKCLIYQQHKASGLEQAWHGLYPLVVWLIADQRRRDRLVAAIRADKRLDERLFRVIDPSELVPLATNSAPSEKAPEAVSPSTGVAV